MSPVLPPGAFVADLRSCLGAILEAVREIELRGGTEEDLRIRLEQILREYVWSKLGLPHPQYEYRVDVGAYARSYGRVDSLYGLVVFEYKRPGALRTKERDEAVRKLVEVYVPGLLKDRLVEALVAEARRRGLVPKVVGVVTDGYGVVFVDCNAATKACTVEPEVGFYDLRSERGVEYLRRIVRAVIASYRKKMDARLLAANFGYASLIARELIKKLYAILESPRSGRTKLLFDEWLKRISQAYPVSGEELAKIAELYGFSSIEKVDGVRLFYAIQTYYSMLLKLLAAEVAARFYDASASVYLRRLKRAPDLRRELDLLERGFVYKWYGVKNFLEGEFFSWYLEEWDDEIERYIRRLIEELDEYDVEVLTLDTRAARDLFKLLYEELIPRKEVRQKLGIYSTPDWLAELILDELGLSVDGMVKMLESGRDPLDLRVLDPGVGTGTFLSLAIQRLGEYLRRVHGGSVPPKVAHEALRKIVKNVVGFDIDALAVLTARANYLIALAAAGLLEYKGGEEIEIPIYLANSMVIAEGSKESRFVALPGRESRLAHVLRISTAVGTLDLPYSLLETGKLVSFLEDIGRCLERGESPESSCVRETVSKYLPLEEERAVALEFYGKLLDLKRESLDDVWVPLIKSYLVPSAYRNSFNYVVGNPPWLAYRYISDPGYQSLIKGLIKDTYSLVLDENLMTHMEMATLFFVRSSDLYLVDGGLIGFVMPRAIFSADQHDAFRRGNYERVELKLLKVVDCERVEPLFYVPACVIIAKRGGKTKYPVEALVIEGRLPEDKHKVMPLSEAKGSLTISRKELHLNVVGSRSFLDYRQLRIVASKSYYYDRFYQGATIVPQPCWFVDVVDSSHPSLIVAQTSRRAEVRGKVEVSIGPLPVEREFIYGVLTSAEVVPFGHLPPNVAVLPIAPVGRRYTVIDKGAALRHGYKHLARWLEEAERVWNRVRKRKEGRFTIYEWLDYQGKLTSHDPRAKYRVVYLTSGSHLAAAVVNVGPYRLGGLELKDIIVGHTLYTFHTDSEEEAYYLVAVLNSTTLDELIKPMQAKGEFGERHIVKKPLEFPIPKYNPSSPLHRRLSELGRAASERVRQALPGVLAELGYDRKLRERGTLVPTEVARLRDKVREVVRNLLNEIDPLALELLSSTLRISTLDKYSKGLMRQEDS